MVSMVSIVIMYYVTQTAVFIKVYLPFTKLSLLLQGMCYFQCAMNYCLIVVSMMTLGFISIDRFVHIVYPLQYLEIITVRRIRIMIAWTWIQGLIIGI